MHDLVHDLACFITQGEFSTMNNGADAFGSIPINYRYASISFDLSVDLLIPKIGFSLTYLPKIGDGAKLRSLHLFSEIYKTIHKFKLDPSSTGAHIRVLDFGDIDIGQFPNFDIVGKLKQLRFLRFSSSRIKVLPDSIGSLYNLQSLYLNCPRLRKLPKGMGNLKNLTHLDIQRCERLTEMPLGLGRLTALQTLTLFSVGKKAGQSISELQHLNHIKGDLTITFLNKVKDTEEAEAARLGDKAGIKSLVFIWGSNKNMRAEEAVLESLRPHPNLRHLILRHYHGKTLPKWLGNPLMLPHLNKLQLFHFQSCESLPALGQLPSLEHLTIESINGLTRIGRELFFNLYRDSDRVANADADGNPRCIFPSLKFLSLNKLSDLEEWNILPNQEDNGWYVLHNVSMFPSLEKLEISCCPKLIVKPHMLSSISELKISYSNSELLEEGGILQGLSRLRYLQIRGMTTSTSNEEFRGWQGLQYLTTLQKLEIQWCEELNCLPKGVLLLPSLKFLKFDFNTKLKSLGIEEEEEEEERGSEEGYQLVRHQPQPYFRTSLHHLHIICCDELIALPEWVGDISSLQTLEITWCDKLAVLPDGLQRLTGLQQLTIHNCPLLTKRCEDENGEDWLKIAHIPNIDIRG